MAEETWPHVKWEEGYIHFDIQSVDKIQALPCVHREKEGEIDGLWRLCCIVRGKVQNA